jgi:hypothetical protein
MVRPGTFIAAIGADNENKQEIDPELLAKAKVVTDHRTVPGDRRPAPCGHGGPHGLTDVYAELGEIVSGLKRGRTSADKSSSSIPAAPRWRRRRGGRRAGCHEHGSNFSFNARIGVAGQPIPNGKDIYMSMLKNTPAAQCARPVLPETEVLRCVRRSCQRQAMTRVDESGGRRGPTS